MSNEIISANSDNSEEEGEYVPLTSDVESLKTSVLDITKPEVQADAIYTLLMTLAERLEAHEEDLSAISDELSSSADVSAISMLAAEFVALTLSYVDDVIRMLNTLYKSAKDLASQGDRRMLDALNHLERKGNEIRSKAEELARLGTAGVEDGE